MRQIEAKTYVSEEILLHEYDYMYGDKKDQKVKLHLYQHRYRKGKYKV